MSTPPASSQIQRITLTRGPLATVRVLHHKDPHPLAIDQHRPDLLILLIDVHRPKDHTVACVNTAVIQYLPSTGNRRRGPKRFMKGDDLFKHLSLLLSKRFPHLPYQQREQTISPGPFHAHLLMTCHQGPVTTIEAFQHLHTKPMHRPSSFCEELERRSAASTKKPKDGENAWCEVELHHHTYKELFFSH